MSKVRTSNEYFILIRLNRLNIITDNVFTNVSKGMLASSKDLLDAFGTADTKAVCREILDKGELQVNLPTLRSSHTAA
jgi:ribosome maturation protein Sdo1